jgi:hypothetical protein
VDDAPRKRRSRGPVDLGAVSAELAAAAREPYVPPEGGARKPRWEEIVDPLGRKAVEVLPDLFRHTDPGAAAAAVRALGFGEPEVRRLAEALVAKSFVKGLHGLDRSPTPGAAAVLRALDRKEGAGPGFDALRRWLTGVGVRSFAEEGLPSLPARLPLTLEELRDLAKLLGATFDEESPGTAGPVKLGGWSCDDPETLVARHIASDGDAEPFAPEGRKLDIRTLRPFSDLELIGADATGDGLYIARRLRTRTGTAPVVRLCHDQHLTAELEANSVYELAARGILYRWADAHGLAMHRDVFRLLHETEVALASSSS